MRVLFMADVPPDPDSGAAGTEYQTIMALQDAGHHVDALWAADLGRRIAHGNLHYLFELPRAYRRAMCRALATQHYDVVHVNQPHGFLAARELRRLSPEAVFVHRSHGIETAVSQALAPWNLAAGSRPLFRRLASSTLALALDRRVDQIAAVADGHIVSSRHDAEFLMHRHSVPLERIGVIPQAAPESFTTADVATLTDERLRRVLYVGQHAFVKAPDVVGAAFSSIHEVWPDVRLTWVCNRVDHDKAIQSLSVSARPNVEMLDWTSTERLMDVYDRHGIFLFPSYYEGFGKAFLEAMTRGLCVIATDVGGARDVITSGLDGILVPPGRPEEVALAASALLADSSRARAMSAAATVIARAYSWHRVASETAAFYDKLRAMPRYNIAR